MAGTCGEDNLDFVTKTLGADKAEDYHLSRPEMRGDEKFDLMLDCVGGKSLVIVDTGQAWRQANQHRAAS